MKELSIEEKAKAYDGVREKIAIRFGSNVAEEIFSQFEMSEDERIRQFLIHEVTETSEEIISYRNMNKKDVLAWLEKQGKTNMGISEATKQKLEDSLNKALEKETSESFNKFLDEQGKQKEINLVEILKHYPKETELYSPLYGKLWLAEVDEENEIITCYKYPLNKGCTRAILEQEDTVSFYSNGTTGLPDFNVSKDCMLFLYDIEKQGEQKPTDKVEPKFHEGDWIVNNEHNNIAKVLEVNEQYRLDYCDTIGTVSIELIDNDYHLWTIQDAKDGDVLAAEDKDKIFIYNGKLDLRGRTCAHCGIYKIHDGLRFTECAIGNYFTYKEPHLATKEQRAALIKAMADEGYTFDFEKKELKKIEEEVNGEDYGIDSLYHAQRILEKTLGEVDGYQSDDGILEHKCAITAVKKLYKQKPAWSEEDERMYRGLHNLIYSTPYCDSRKELSDWLKSLKDRVQPQQQEWSEEDEEALEVAIIALENMYSEDSPLDCYAGHHMPFDKAANQLKYLKERYTWKPSDEQIEALDYYANSLCTYCDRQDDLRSLFNDLKRLREE